MTTSHTLDKLTSFSNPCINFWAQTIDQLSDNPKIGALTTRLVGPLVLFPALADAAIHLSIFVTKTLYCIVTGTLEVLRNAFNFSRHWISINPLGTVTWNRWEAGRHLVRSIEDVAIGITMSPVAFVKPDWAVHSIRYLDLAKPAAEKPKPETPEETPKPPTTMEKISQYRDAIIESVLAPLDWAHRGIIRYPYFAWLTGQAAYGLAIGTLFFGLHWYTQKSETKQ